MSLSINSFTSIRSRVRRRTTKPNLRRPSWAKFVAKSVDPSAKYTVAGLISEGGFGKVFRATRKRRWYAGGSSNEPVVAIKICRSVVEEAQSFIDSGESLEFDEEEEDMLSNTYSSHRTHFSRASNKPVRLRRDPDAAKTIENETSIMRRLRSPYIVKLRESFELPGGDETWIVMEFVPLSLRSALDQNKLTQDLNRIIAAGVIQGLKYLQGRRIIHRDVKVENVLISATGWVKLCDFDCSVQLAKGETSALVDHVKGTFQFMAPELFIHGQMYDYAVDVWSFGQLLYVLCFGDPKVKRNGFYDPIFWESYKKSVAHYYQRLLGSAFLYPEEVRSLAQEVDMRIYHRRHRAYGPLVPFLRSCAVPYPVNGPKGDIDIKSPLKRATLTELEQSEYMKYLKSELKQRQELVRLVAECEDTESVCVDYASI